MGAGEALDFFQRRDEGEHFVLVGLLFALQQVHELVVGLLEAVGHHVQQAAARNVATGKDGELVVAQPAK